MGKRTIIAVMILAYVGVMIVLNIFNVKLV